MSNGGSSPACSRRYVFTQLPSVPSFRPSSRATCAIGRELSITNFTASSRYSGENFLRLDDIMPLYLTDGIIVVPVREPRGPSVSQRVAARLRGMGRGSGPGQGGGGSRSVAKQLAEVVAGVDQ